MNVGDLPPGGGGVVGFFYFFSLSLELLVVAKGEARIPGCVLGRGRAGEGGFFSFRQLSVWEFIFLLKRKACSCVSDSPLSKLGDTILLKMIRGLF